MPSLGDILPEVADGGFQNPLDNPAAANEAISTALSASGADWPQPEPLASDLVTLPGGLVVDGELITHARVKELTGADEEAIARASVSLNPFHFINTLLECGVVQIGDLHPKKTRELLKKLLVGDRDALIMGIRRCTYGDDIEVEEWTCPECQINSNLSIPLDDIPVRKLETPGDPELDVDLRKGRVARIALANGADQLAVFENKKLNLKERDTLLIERTLISIREVDGTVNTVVGYSHGTAVAMNMGDRNKILKKLATCQPGPQFGEVKFVHDACAKEVTVAVGIGDMFPDL
jgi:hypothetical protein